MIVQSVTFEGPFSQLLTVDYKVEDKRLVPTVVRVVRYQKATHEDITQHLKPDELRWLIGYLLEITQ